MLGACVVETLTSDNDRRLLSDGMERSTSEIGKKISKDARSTGRPRSKDVVHRDVLRVHILVLDHQRGQKTCPVRDST